MKQIARMKARGENRNVGAVPPCPPEKARYKADQDELLKLYTVIQD